MGKRKRKIEKSIESIMIAIGVLDRVQGTEVYKLEKEFYGWTDKDYEIMLEDLGNIYQALTKASKRGNNDDESNG